MTTSRVVFQQLDSFPGEMFLNQNPNLVNVIETYRCYVIHVFVVHRQVLKS